VQNVATPHKFTAGAPLSREGFPVTFSLSVLFVAALWFALCRQLSGEWSVNAQYNYGWFVPLFALYLFWVRWQDRPAPEVRVQKSVVSSKTLIASAIAIVSLLLLLAVRLFEIANPEWRLLAWSHALVVVTLTLLLLWWAGGKAWLWYFAFPVLFMFIAVPWPTALETPVIQGLMRAVARVAAETAMLLGTPAQVEGNLIRVSNGLVGVNEACSGIRSLQTSLMIGLLFGELKRLSVLRRVALVVCAVAIALLANFVRAVFLVHIAATENLSEVGRWHDIAGYSIIALVFVATMVFAYLLGRKKAPAVAGVSPAARALQPTRLPLQFPVSYLAAALCWLLFVEIGTAAWYRIHERNLVSGRHWTVQWPEQWPNFRKLKIDPEIRSVLRFDEGQGAAWMLTPPPTSESSAPAKTSGTQVNRLPPHAVAYLYVFRWNPGRNSALLANLHRPDVCLPASGWTQIADHGVRNYPVKDGFELPFRYFEFQRGFDGSPPQTAHAFYCLSEDHAVTRSTSREGADAPGMYGNRSEWTRAERLDSVLKGRRHLGQQVIEVVLVSSEPFSAADAESYLSNLIRNVVAFHEPEK
jgi:exosortase